MPELPEVQTVVSDLIAAGVPGAAISAVTVRWPRSIAQLTPRSFCRRINGVRINGLRRRAKYIIFDLDGPDVLAVHLRMTGRFELAAAPQEPGPHDHVLFNLDDGRQLRFHDTRKFGRFYLLEDPDSFFKRLGPEPLEAGFTARRLGALLDGKHRQIKPLLLDQTVIAGLGNIYTDEALWYSRIHPQRNADTLSRQEVNALHRAIRAVLRQGIRNCGTTLGRGSANFYSLSHRRGENATELNVFRRHGLACRRCGATVARMVVAQRSSHFCPDCQQLY